VTTISPVRCNYCRGNNGHRKGRENFVCTCGPDNRCHDATCMWSEETRRGRRHKQYYVQDANGVPYKVGVWEGGKFRPGSLADAYVELDKLDEEGAKVVENVGGRYVWVARPSESTEGVTRAGQSEPEA
jgi:hypothetical protein